MLYIHLINRKLGAKELKELAKTAIKIEEHWGCAQDIEWGIDKELPFPENVFMLQARPVTKKFEKESTAKRVTSMLSRYL